VCRAEVVPRSLAGELSVTGRQASLKNEGLWKHAQVVVSPGPPNDTERRRESVRTILESGLRKHNLPTDCVRNVRLSRVPLRIAPGG
jgi:hypothetical protein